MEVAKRSTRDAYGESLLSICKANSHIYVVDADNSRSTRTVSVRKACPEQFIDVGSAEQNLLGVAAGVALTGKRVFVSTFSSFIIGRSLDILKSVIALQNLDVVVTGTHSGLSSGELGWSHHMITDLAIFLSLPNFCVMVPADVNETKEMVDFLAQSSGPAYLRLGRGPVPVIQQSAEPFNLNTPRFIRKGSDVLLLTYGRTVDMCIQVADILSNWNISCAIFEIHTLKPLDPHRVANIASDYKTVLVVEEHHVHGGLGSLLLPSLIRKCISSFDIMAIPDIVPRSLPYEILLKECGLCVEHIVNRIKELCPQ
jgi:transketolase